jgi:multidrug efflux pump subunit AcrB
MFSLAAKARPFFGAIVLTAALLCAAGVWSARQMPSGVYPEVTFPRVAVLAKAPGRDLTTMEVKVTRPLEEAVSTALGVAFVRSKTIRGVSEVSVTFNPGTDMRQATQQVWNRIGARRADLPADLDMIVEQMTPSSFPILSVVLTGGDDASQLRDYAVFQLAPRLKTIPDVLYANVDGGDVREIEVIARPDDLRAAGLSAADLADAIGQVSALQPVGRVEGQPYAYQILIDNQPASVRAVEDLVVSTRNERPLRVSDVADVKVLHADRTLSIGYDRRDAVAVNIFRRLGGNTGNVSRDVRALLEKDGLALPPGDPHKKPPRNIQAVVVYDQATFVNAAVGDVRDAIVVGGAFSVLILLAFLRSWRATLISALAIPATLAITFLFLWLSGQTLNLMSLGGLAVAIGLIIDDTVVVIENIARHRAAAAKPADRNGQAVDAVDAASKEITGAVVGSTLTTVLVFVPLAFVAGVYGQFFAALSWSLSVAVLVSMVVSLTLVPVFAARFLGGRPMPAPGRIYRFFEHVYEFVLRLALRFPWAMLALSLAAVGVGVLLYFGVPDPTAAPAPGQPRPTLVRGLETGLLPSMDEGTFILDYWAPSGTPLAETEKMAHDLEKVLSENPDVLAYVRRTGSENGLFATQTSRGDIEGVLRPAELDPVSLATKPMRPPLDEVEKELKALGKTLDSDDGKAYVRAKYRRRPTNKVREEVEDRIKDLYAEHQLRIETTQVMEDELNDLSGQDKPIEVKLFGPDQAELRRLAQQVADLLEEKGKKGEVRGLAEINSNVFEGNPDLFVRVDETKAQRLGLTADAISRQLRAMFQGQIAAQAPESSARITDVRVRYPDSERFGGGDFSPDRVLRQWVMTQADKQAPPRPVPLTALATVEPTRTPDERHRENQQPAAFVTAQLNEKQAGLGAAAEDVRRAMGEMRLPPGYRWELGGHYRQLEAAVWSFWLVILTAGFLVFILLAFQFRSAVLPLLIFATQPLSLVSGLFALWLTHTPLNVSSGMGAILLVGLDMKNGILLVEYIQKLRSEGVPLKEALLRAGRTRFRPILMTSLAAILGLLPLALGFGPGAQMQKPLAVMVIGGLTANMLFTRAIIPAGYEVLERLRVIRPAAEAAAAAPVPAPAAPAAPPPAPAPTDGAVTTPAPAPAPVSHQGETTCSDDVTTGRS